MHEKNMQNFFIPNITCSPPFHNIIVVRFHMDREGMSFDDITLPGGLASPGHHQRSLDNTITSSRLRGRSSGEDFLSWMLSNADDSGLMDLSSPSSSSTADAAKQPHENLEFQANQVLNAGWEESGASTRSSSRSKAANNSYNNSFANVFDYETTTTSASISNSNNSSRKRNHDNMSSSHTMTMPPQEEVAQSTQFGNQISALQEMLLQTTSVLQTVAHSVNELKKQQQIQLHALKDRQATEHALHSNNSSASSSPTNVPPNPQLQPSPPTATIAKPQKERKKKPR